MKYFLVFLVAFVLLALVIGNASAVTVRVVDTPPQPALRVVEGESIVNPDGSVNWQPAGTIN